VWSVQELAIPQERRYPAPVIAVSNRTEARQVPSENQHEATPPAPPKKPAYRTTLPDDLLDRSDEEAARRLALKAVAAARAAERRLDDRCDPEALHDFRVAVRRLRSLLRAYKPQLESAVRQKDRRSLRDIQRATGGGREAEVALEWLETQQRDLAPEHLAGLNWLSATLMARRRECEHALGGTVRSDFRKTVDRLEEKLAVMKREHNLLTDRPHVSFARTLANLTEAHATDLLVQLGQIARMDDSEQLHEARIMGKRLRYLLEPVRAYVDDAQAVVKRTKRLQDVLGDLNDVHVLMDEIDRAFDDSLRQKAGRIKSSLRRGDIERARREATLLEWPGLVELYSRLENERRRLIGKLRDEWLDGELDALVQRARNLAHDLRERDAQ
jgi:CHAD domain-containing protein